jgi:type VI protein secretion system component Hcp
MAVDGYMYFQNYSRMGGGYLLSESTVDLSNNSEPLCSQFKFPDVAKANGLFEIEDFSFDIEQTLNIGSQSSGAGAGRVTFNPFSITRKIDRSSPVFFERACSGTPFQQVTLGLRKASGGPAGSNAPSGQIYLVFNFKLVAVKTISWSYDDESPKETVTYEYGGLQVFYNQQLPNGKMDGNYKGGWNRVKNTADQTADPIGS